MSPLPGIGVLGSAGCWMDVGGLGVEGLGVGGLGVEGLGVGGLGAGGFERRGAGYGHGVFHFNMNPATALRAPEEAHCSNSASVFY
jgi:hypothetical protein